MKIRKIKRFKKNICICFNSIHYKFHSKLIKICMYNTEHS